MKIKYLKYSSNDRINYHSILSESETTLSDRRMELFSGSGSSRFIRKIESLPARSNRLPIQTNLQIERSNSRFGFFRNMAPRRVLTHGVLSPSSSPVDRLVLAGFPDTVSNYSSQTEYYAIRRVRGLRAYIDLLPQLPPVPALRTESYFGEIDGTARGLAAAVKQKRYDADPTLFGHACLSPVSYDPPSPDEYASVFC